MADIVRWSPGETIVIRGILKGKLWWACPAYIVQDRVDVIAYYWPVGTPTRSPIRRPTVRDELENRIKLVNRNWTDHNILSLNRPGAAYSIELMREATSNHIHCWYVHLQEPLRRTRIGFDTMDQMLDIVISPDRTAWRWKDEDEFTEAEAIGVYSTSKAKSIRTTGKHVIAQLKANASPFCDGWEAWRPPGEWTIPMFSDGWEDIPID